MSDLVQVGVTNDWPHSHEPQKGSDSPEKPETCKEADNVTDVESRAFSQRCCESEADASQSGALPRQRSRSLSSPLQPMLSSNPKKYYMDQRALEDLNDSSQMYQEIQSNDVDARAI